jgi:hypothetical protein
MNKIIIEAISESDKIQVDIKGNSAEIATILAHLANQDEGFKNILYAAIKAIIKEESKKKNTQQV